MGDEAPEHLGADALEALGTRLLAAAGTPADVAEEVAAHVVDNSLRGIDSHGIVRLPYYLDLIHEGVIDPGGRAAVAKDEPGVTLIDGGGGFGIPAIRLAAEMMLQKIESQASAVAAVVNCGHTGRVGAYAEMIARAGCFALVLGGGGHERFRSVVPYGGREGVMSTNPYALALPGGPTGAVVVDFATSATAQGKVLYARAAGTPLPEGMIIDKQGRPSRNAEDYFAGGFLLPAAGPKGYGLGLIAELLGYGLLGAPRELNWILFAFDLETFGGREAYRERTESYLAWVKSCAPAPGFGEVMVPGEPEQRCREARLAEGIAVPPEIRATLCAWAGRLGVDLADVPGLTWTGAPARA